MNTDCDPAPIPWRRVFALLWPENDRSPNLKDQVENYLHARVCDGGMSLASAQRIIALDWVSFYDQNLRPKPKPGTPPPTPAASPRAPPSPTDESVVHPRAFCSPQGATGHTSAGTPTVCKPASAQRSLAAQLNRGPTEAPPTAASDKR